MPAANLEKLRQEYDSNAALYSALCFEVVRQIEFLLREERVILSSPPEHRVKTWDSIIEKIERNQSNPEALSDMRDVAGIRVIALFRRDRDLVERIIEGHFKVLHKEDASARLTENQFGYGSVHYEVQPSPHWLKIPTLRKLAELRAEIQVRTGSQHIWAAASHVLQYKREAHVPLPLRRSISRVAALLETVDLEFERFLSEREEYAKHLTALDQSLPLNVDSLRSSLTALLPPDNGSDDEDYAGLLDDLSYWGIRTTADLELMMKNHLADVLTADRSRAEEEAEISESRPLEPRKAARVAAGIFYTHVGLCRTALRQEFGKAFTDYQISKREDKKT